MTTTNDELISRAAAVRALASSNGDYLDALERLEKIPAVGAVPVVHARWQGVSPFVDTEECSNCRYNIQSEELETPYCPWCGARMDGERRDSE